MSEDMRFAEDVMKIQIKCPLCDIKSLDVMKEGTTEIMQCYNCGYSTNGDYKYVGDKTTNQYYSNLDPSMKRWSVEANGYIWLPSILTFDSGFLYPYENAEEKMKF